MNVYKLTRVTTTGQYFSNLNWLYCNLTDHLHYLVKSMWTAEQNMLMPINMLLSIYKKGLSRDFLQEFAPIQPQRCSSLRPRCWMELRSSSSSETKLRKLISQTATKLEVRYCLRRGSDE